MIAPIIFEGNCNEEIFTTYVETILIKELYPGQIVIMDNINFHKNNRLLSKLDNDVEWCYKYVI
ncbi:transposase [Orientia tsutsugamushi]|uniref:transposase n=1 Tax=Orientia tsutsugamushi TaxID=784 RepID=UPI0040468C2E